MNNLDRYWFLFPLPCAFSNLLLLLLLLLLPLRGRRSYGVFPPAASRCRAEQQKRLLGIFDEAI